jgi:hypothetical protein
MEIFAHINELGLEGWNSLRTLVIGSARVILWAPSASYLEECRTYNPILPTSDELIYYIRNYHIQVICREWWLKNTNKRKNNPWGHAKVWTTFDDEILKIWEEDQREGRTGTTARVVAVLEEDGWDWARTKLESGEIDIDRLVYALGHIPGNLQKAAHQENMKDAAISFLRDARNHGMAFRFSHADRNFGLPTDPTLSKVIKDCTTSEEIRRIPFISFNPNVDQLISVVNSVMHKLQQSKNTSVSSDAIFKRTKDLLHDDYELSNIREWISSCDMLSGHLREEDQANEIADRLAKTIEQNAPKVKISDYILPKSPIQRIAAITGLGLGIVGLFIGSQIAPISLSLLVLRPSETMLQQLGWLAEDYKGARWPFYIAEGSRKSRRKTREAMLKALKH